MLQRLQQWYLAECNGDWEHSYGVKIETLDNPGWHVVIDLSETAWANLSVEPTPAVLDEDEPNWIHYKIHDGRFQGACGPIQLEELLNKFFELIGYVGTYSTENFKPPRP
jgi:hypothetical protein